MNLRGCEYLGFPNRKLTLATTQTKIKLLVLSRVRSISSSSGFERSDSTLHCSRPKYISINEKTLCRVIIYFFKSFNYVIPPDILATKSTRA